MIRTGQLSLHIFGHDEVDVRRKISVLIEHR